MHHASADEKGVPALTRGKILPRRDRSELICELTAPDLEVVGVLQTQPIAVAQAKEAAEPEVGVHRDPAPPEDDLPDALRGDARLLGMPRQTASRRGHNNLCSSCCLSRIDITHGSLGHNGWVCRMREAPKAQHKPHHHAKEAPILSQEVPTMVAQLAEDLERTGRLGQERLYPQHGSTSVYDHSIRVASVSLRLADVLDLTVDRTSLVRGALLHDYFLYDWHSKDHGHRPHGFTHPATALANAMEDYDLNETEKNIILRHMFPLVPHPPGCREAWVVCAADKVCALEETVPVLLAKVTQAGRASS